MEKSYLNQEQKYIQPRITSLTTKEIESIRDYYTSSDYFFYPIHALCTKAKRDFKVYACPKTWSHYIKTLNLKKSHQKPLKSTKYHVGIQANRANELWHIDVTEIRINKKRVFLQAIIDNYSRFIISFQFLEKLGGLKTSHLIKTSITKYGPPQKLMSDAGKENLNANVSILLEEKSIKHYVAKQNTRYSNSRIETLFRMLKSNFLSSLKIKDHLTLIRKVEFYFHHYNNEIPHIAIECRTPKEAFDGVPPDFYKKQFQKFRKKTIQNRKFAYLKLN